jgi:hypothetical protein
VPSRHTLSQFLGSLESALDHNQSLRVRLSSCFAVPNRREGYFEELQGALEDLSVCLVGKTCPQQQESTLPKPRKQVFQLISWKLDCIFSVSSCPMTFQAHVFRKATAYLRNPTKQPGLIATTVTISKHFWMGRSLQPELTCLQSPAGSDGRRNTCLRGSGSPRSFLDVDSSAARPGRAALVRWGSGRFLGGSRVTGCIGWQAL